MSSPAHTSDQTLAAARNSLANNRAGGRRVAGKSIGRRSAGMKRRHLAHNLMRAVFALFALWVGASIAGFVIGGIGIGGIMLVALLSVIGFAVFTRYPRMTVPDRADLTKGDAHSVVGRTELWLESQRPALPAPAVNLVDQIGVQLDALGLQLQGLDQTQPAAIEVRRLVGDHLPELISSYRQIPAHLRSEARAGRTPDEQLVDSLGKISTEIDSVTRQLADGAIDDLAIKTRYLDYKYGDGDAPTSKDAN